VTRGSHFLHLLRHFVLQVLVAVVKLLHDLLILLHILDDWKITVHYVALAATTVHEKQYALL